MKHLFQLISLMLMNVILFDFSTAHQPYHSIGRTIHRHLAGRGLSTPTPTFDNTISTVSPCSGLDCVAIYPQVSNLPCTEANGTTIIAGTNSQKWTILCDIDFFAQDIYPFVLVSSFEECLKYCDSYNQGEHDEHCAGFVFAPDRTSLANDCYLKSSVENIVSPSTIHLIGATLVPESSAVGYGVPDDGSSSLMPTAAAIKLLGTSTNKASEQYVSHLPALPMKLASTLLQPGINTDLITKYPLAADTGSWTESTIPLPFQLANLTTAPGMSRDGGKGGNINGTHVFYFCDTSTFGDVEGPLGYMNGFVSSSAAVDTSQKALYGDPLELHAPIGQWQDDVGRLRGWIPMTTGEEAFNIAVSGQGYRYAVWPESSFIPLNSSHSIIYASVVYVEVNMQTQSADFTSLGNTLAVVSVDQYYGPHADRLVNQLFTEDEVQWGSLGGVRAWGKSGQGGNDGMIYLFGQVDKGILVAKVAPKDIANRSAYSYWNGTAWSSVMPSKSSTAYLIDQPVMDFDMIYSPTWKTFFMIYLTPLADNTFYIRGLQTQVAVPPYALGGSDDYVENILHHNWSSEAVLYQADAPAQGYIYAGGCHLGYFGDDDFANGGTKLLITWTEHTEKDPSDPSSGYAHKSAVVTLK